jgi:probable rRNA maturation factor
VRRGVALTIVVAGDATLRRLNRDFAGIDAPTDVLSFEARDSDEEFGGGFRPRRVIDRRSRGSVGARSETFAQRGDTYLGDVIISLPRARAQAKSGGHSLIDELRLLVIHGVLHLLGHDHHEPAEKKRMWAVQAKALKKVGASIEGPADS